MQQSNLIVTPGGVVETDKYLGSCNCGGTRNLKYQKGKYIIYFLPKRRSFHLKSDNHYIVKNQPIIDLCPKLKSLGLIVSGASSEIN